MTNHPIQVGRELWSWQVNGAYTEILDEEGDFTFEINPVTEDVTVIASCIEAYGRGYAAGKKAGRIEKVSEIRFVLGIQNT